VERVFLLIQHLYFKRKSIRNINISTGLFFLIIIFFQRKAITLEVLYKVLNSDIFTLSGVLAGFLFTGLGMIYTSSNERISDLKITGNFKLVNNFFIHSIFYYILVVLIYLGKSLFIQNVEVTSKSINLLTISMMGFLMLGIHFFITATILFLIAMFILSKVINSN